MAMVAVSVPADTTENAGAISTSPGRSSGSGISATTARPPCANNFLIMEPSMPDEPTRPLYAPQNDRPMKQPNPLHARIADAVAANRDEIVALSMAIHANPEPGFEERAASALVAETLARHGYAVERP